MTKSYNRYGYHTTLSPLGLFLIQDAPGFGEAIVEITATLHFPCSGPALSTLESLLDSYNSLRATLPKVTFRRAKKKIAIDVASDLMDARDWKPAPRLSLPLFERGLDEVLEALPLIKRRLKISDAFDLDALQELAAHLKAAEDAKRQLMSPWEKLDIDWSDFHPAARNILDDPFFWEDTNFLSPNGNDTGADLLESYRGWISSRKDGQALEFLESLAIQWGYASTQLMNDELRNEAVIGLAFADLKLRGKCDDEVRQFALDCLRRQRTRTENLSISAQKLAQLAALRKIEEVLLRKG